MRRKNRPHMRGRQSFGFSGAPWGAKKRPHVRGRQSLGFSGAPWGAKTVHMCAADKALDFPMRHGAQNCPYMRNWQSLGFSPVRRGMQKLHSAAFFCYLFSFRFIFCSSAAKWPCPCAAARSEGWQMVRRSKKSRLFPGAGGRR